MTLVLFDLLHIICQKFREQSPYVCRALVQQIEKGRIEEAEKKHHELTKQIASATLLQVEAMFQSDLEKLKAKLPGKKEAAAEHALNIKYLKDRQKNLGRLDIGL